MPLLTRGGSNPKTFLVTLTLHSNIIRGDGRLKAKISTLKQNSRVIPLTRKQNICTWIIKFSQHAILWQPAKSFSFVGGNSLDPENAQNISGLMIRRVSCLLVSSLARNSKLKRSESQEQSVNSVLVCSPHPLTALFFFVKCYRDVAKSGWFL